MEGVRGKLTTMILLITVWLCGPARSMTIQVGTEGMDLVPAGAVWKFFRGQQPASTPPDAWRQVDFDDARWEMGPAGFGFADNDDATVLNDMLGRYATVYIRREFSVAVVTPNAPVELTIDYDDGFIAYLNGKEVARRNMPTGAATYGTLASTSREAGTPETINLGLAGDLLRVGKNVLAVEGHNNSLTSSDFSLIPTLRTDVGHPAQRQHVHRDDRYGRPDWTLGPLWSDMRARPGPGGLWFRT